jgi:hypothetical protein
MLKPVTDELLQRRPSIGADPMIGCLNYLPASLPVFGKIFIATCGKRRSYRERPLWRTAASYAAEGLPVVLRTIQNRSALWAVAFDKAIKLLLH